jgi:hypothetical protein
MRVVGSVSCWVIQRSKNAPTDARFQASLWGLASIRVRSFSAAFLAALRPVVRDLDRHAVCEVIRSPVLESSLADTRTWTRSSIRRTLPRCRGFGRFRTAVTGAKDSGFRGS